LSTFEYFFEDFSGMIKAPDAYMVGVLCNLDSTIYKPGDTIIRHKAMVEELIVIHRGRCNLVGFI
jgi:hypothetical protein